MGMGALSRVSNLWLFFTTGFHTMTGQIVNTPNNMFSVGIVTHLGEGSVEGGN
jgi:hypothetical protein